MHPAPTLLLAAAIALGSNAVFAQAKASVVIHFASGDTCIVADAHVPCRDVGAKLRELGIPEDADLQFSPDAYVSYEAIRAMMDSIRVAGYKVVKVGFITSPR